MGNKNKNEGIKSKEKTDKSDKEERKKPCRDNQRWETEKYKGNRNGRK